MKCQIFAALLIGAASTLTFAQTAPEVPKAKCEPKPVLPGERMMEEANVRKRFQSDLDAYKKCMTAYLDDRKASMKAHEIAANAAIEEYNGTMKALADAQKAQQ
jgi:Skp family chaperone for outer membrane proteins